MLLNSVPLTLLSEFMSTISWVYSRNWPMRGQWVPFCNIGGLFFKKGGP